MSGRSENLEGSPAHVLMKRALDLLPDGVLIIGSDREVLYLNAAFQRLWRIPRDVIRKGDAAMLGFVTSQLEDPEEFIGLVERLYRLPDSWEDQISFKDGRVFNRRSVALDAGDGGAARIGRHTEGTEAWSARIDPLTGLLNRRAYARELPEFMAAGFEGQIKAFALMDVDHFKPYNDRYGHSAGDAALEALGDLLRTETDDGTRVYRIGGEEFAMTSVHRDQATATRYHERIRRCVGEAKIPHDGNAPYGVLTMSMGVGLVSGKAELRGVFDEADRALYRAKKRGRNALIVVDLNEHLNRLTA
mgnify:FL=1